LATKQRKAENQQQREHDLARVRKQHQREREQKGNAAKEPRSKVKHNATTVLMQGADTIAYGSSAIPDVASLSRPTTQGWKKHHVGTQGGAVQKQAQRVFWFDPFLWAIIELTIRRCG
jgi:hypothetical protein